MQKNPAMPHATLITCLAAATLALALTSGCASGSSSEPQGTSEPTSTQTSATEPEPTSAIVGEPTAERPVLEVLDEDMQAVYANRDTVLPVAVEYWVAGEGGVTSWAAYGEDAVNQTLDAIEQMVVTGETDMVAEDDSEGYRFINEDGSLAGSVSFNMGNLETGGKHYTVSSTSESATFPFPAAFQFAEIWEAIPDSALFEFLGRCEAGENVTSVSVTANGETKTTTSEEAVANAVNALFYAEVGYAGMYDGSGENISYVTFTMEDGTEYTFSFEGGFYLYEFPEPLGTWCYYSDSFEDLAKAAD